ncbi:MAG: hypothetical protein Q8K64_01365 [Sediminibacterium sp.]|nr:hypothetical protein [Sediminibacterium sp.]TXT33547.1 MAG: hypothetical protein FD136_828 [Chitinophagaceae bacterium]
MKQRKKMGFLTIVLIGVGIGFFIKNVKIGLIIGLVLGLLGGGIMGSKSK